MQKEKIIPVDDYVGGGHVVQHLLFARFFWKVLFDLGYIDKKQGDEPFLKLRAPGWILGPDSRKMSKRWGNVVTPDDIIPKFGADTLRVYEMFMGPFDIMKPWSIAGVEGSYRFLGRLYRLLNQKSEKVKDLNKVLTKLNQTIKKVGEDIENYKFNTAISSIMELTNLLQDNGLNDEIKLILTKLMAPFAPHMMEEVWKEILDNKESIHLSKWPEFDPKYLTENEVVIAVQINGKLRGTITIESNLDKENIITLAKQDKKIAQWLSNGELRKKYLFLANLLTSSSKLPILFLLGLILIGFGVLAYKTNVFSSGDKVEVLNNSTETLSVVSEIVVEISGSVERPSVYKMHLGDRIDDLLISAGGISADADRDWVEKYINKASKLVDGQKIYIYHSGEVTAKDSSSIKLDQPILGANNQNSGNLISINDATLKELMELPEIAQERGKKIIENRFYSNIKN